ncbi:hypothetical protein [Paludisphaera mucosa]|uniref:Uncharacterized protein n=1 Tax=Paludisphaera mucosa TaxID=3030827 RepID=A0ABT6FLI0_9BACT|nr:hypothetical protein [Paludisphaera mucosa]MDG3008419.1 hypothetical protein [Paludisphaera mucosa]
MRAFVGEIDHTGLRRFIPEDQVARNELHRLTRRRHPGPSAFVWTLLADEDAEDLRVDVGTGRHAEAYSLLLNRAVELISLRDAASGCARAES